MLKKTFDVNLLKDGLSELLSAIQNQEEVTLIRDGVPLAKVLPFPFNEEKVTGDNKLLKPRTAGGWEGQIWMADDFDDESPEINAMFYGEDE
ncbi:toxin-antitoxin system antidote component (plasmid) [Cyanobacterium sp. HL-69]|uniref:type II toxin-antitoxin system Phd/YefM family antitoxin n=1 Tax=Cyanobacterium sp. HL-69 TaxID=2054282 RepID=UPI000CA0AA49|nr:toxin-antitoxin system antidote component [Cyanobacterium sp. HL-69]